MYFQLRHKAEDIAQMKIRSPWREDACEIIFSSMMISSPPNLQTVTHTR